MAILLLFTMPLAVMAASASEPPPPAKITVFTNSAAYAPLQSVQMYANVTYAGTALVNQNVVFYVRNSNGSIVATRAADTNDSGIANAAFRMPLASQNLTETGFGAWSVTGAVNVAQVGFNDTANFTFDYLSRISNIQFPPSINQLSYLDFSITVDNLVNTATWSEVDITLLDSSQTPIGSATATNTFTSQVETINASLLIPESAFPGQATAYICLLAASGVPVAPAGVANFEILPTTSTPNSSNTTEPSSTSIVDGQAVAFVVPEYAYGGLIALGASLAGFIAFQSLKKKRQQ